MTRPCRKGSDYAQDLCENETFYCNGRLMSLPYSYFFDSLDLPLLSQRQILFFLFES